jgi:hypothetical protein
MKMKQAEEVLKVAFDCAQSEWEKNSNAKDDTFMWFINQGVVEYVAKSLNKAYAWSITADWFHVAGGLYCLETLGMRSNER